MEFELKSSFSNEENFKIKIIKNKNNIYNLDKYKFKTQEKLKQKGNFEKNELINKLLEYNTIKNNENKKKQEEDADEIDSLILDDKLNYYGVQKKNIINYKTPIKVNNTRYNKNKNKNKKIEKIKSSQNNNDNNNAEELSNLFSNSSTDDKKVIVSELDIELSNSNSNYYTDYKNNNNYKGNNINMIKKRGIDFKKEIEKNLKKFLKNNQEKIESNLNPNTQNNTVNTTNVNTNTNKKANNDKKIHIKDRMKAKMKLLKKNNNKKFNYCLTDISNKNISNTKNNSNNKISSFITDKVGQNNSNINNSFKNNFELNNRYNIHKNFIDIIKINIPKRINKINNKIASNMNKKINIKNINYNKNKKPMNLTNLYEIKSKIFYLQNKNKKNIFNTKKKDINEHIISFRNNHKKNTITNLGISNINSNGNIHREFFNVSEKEKNFDNSNKKEYNSLNKNEDKINLNLNDKNIIIQNFNCIDYNNINININNNIIKPIRQKKKRNTVNENISNKKFNHFNNLKNNTNFNNNKIRYLCDSCIKNNINDINASLNNSKVFTDKKNLFQRKHNEKKYTQKENPYIKNKILTYYLNKKELTNNNYQKKNNYINVNDKKEYKTFNTSNTISNNAINKESITSKKKELKDKINKQKTYKKIENCSISNNILTYGKNKFIRQRKEKRNTQVCSNCIKKNLIKFKFINFK